ncbi:MAG: hypothetical protein KBD64_02220 [Gammaproteobacteria bacterium]|nr:hypothetical protein [Gammaproteobacteria bacterium]
MSNRKYLLKAMLQYMGYTSTMDGPKLDKLIEKFKININAHPAVLAAQVNKLAASPSFNNHMNQLHKAQYGLNAPAPHLKPLPNPAPVQNQEAEEKLVTRYRQILKPTPFS